MRAPSVTPAAPHATLVEDAMKYHLDALGQAPTYSTARLPSDLRATGPLGPVPERLDPLLRTPPTLTPAEFSALLVFVRDGLLDPDARPERLRSLIPATLPSGRQPLTFQ